MELFLFVIAYILFWCTYYYVEGRHDANVILWKQMSDKKDKTIHEINLEKLYNKNWHKYDAYEKLMVHLTLPIVSLLFQCNIIFIIGLFILSISIRLYVHNMVINKYTGKEIDYIGLTDWFDIFLLELNSSGVSQWIFKGIIFIISIIIILSA